MVVVSLAAFIAALSFSIPELWRRRPPVLRRRCGIHMGKNLFCVLTEKHEGSHSCPAEIEIDKIDGVWTHIATISLAPPAETKLAYAFRLAKLYPLIVFFMFLHPKSEWGATPLARSASDLP